MNDLSLLLELFMEKFHTRTEALKWQRLTQPHSNENQEQSRFPTETQTHTRALFLFGGLDAGMLGMLVCLVFFFFFFKRVWFQSETKLSMFRVFCLDFPFVHV